MTDTRSIKQRWADYSNALTDAKIAAYLQAHPPSGGGGGAPVTATALYYASGATTLAVPDSGTLQVPFHPTAGGHYASDPSPTSMATDGTLTFLTEAEYCLTVNLLLTNGSTRKVQALYNITNGDYIARNGFVEVKGGGQNIWVYTRTLRVAAGDSFTVKLSSYDTTGSGDLLTGQCYLNVDRVGP